MKCNLFFRTLAAAPFVFLGIFKTFTYDLQISKGQFNINYFRIIFRVHAVININNVIIRKRPYHLDNGIHFPDMG